MPPPTSLSSGATLTKDVVVHACLPDTWDRLDGYYSHGYLISDDGVPKLLPRLEMVVEAIFRAIGIKALGPFVPCATAPPNAWHRLAAQHVRAGGRHITCNIDDCIERCLPSSVPHLPIHVHGKVGSLRWESLGLRLSRVSRGMPIDLEDEIIRALMASRVLLFIGYSGSDFFDVTPLFASLSKRSVSLRARA